MAFIEIKRLKAKIRRGDATGLEIERYRQLTSPEIPTASCKVKVIAPPHENNEQGVVPRKHEMIGNKRLYAPVPVGVWGDEGRNTKRQKVTENSSPSMSTKKVSPLVGILRNSKTPSPSRSPAMQTSALLTAMRASNATREQKKYLMTALRSSPTASEKASAFVSFKANNSSQMLPFNPASKPSYEQAAQFRRLTGMQSTAAMLGQTLPPTLLFDAFQSNQTMSTAHLLHRLANPRRRVVHQMLREQNQHILRAMKLQVTPASTGTLNHGKVSPKSNSAVPA
eukprot:CAMPEP_0178884230 /NCGR_PEP_ID=MMETSP0747-20121128/14586_1 /TAXON_ID=913974 /ORGANISM="Nitzschia punctata, Strain CCMP561" /LENGTH=281 /DNA_ID=CAMNT_0020552577 /DNA_START=39 /DNA_END=881 /DNA_ORIENTATION=-